MLQDNRKQPAVVFYTAWHGKIGFSFFFNYFFSASSYLFNFKGLYQSSCPSCVHFLCVAAGQGRAQHFWYHAAVLSLA